MGHPLTATIITLPAASLSLLTGKQCDADEIARKPFFPRVQRAGGTAAAFIQSMAKTGSPVSDVPLSIFHNSISQYRHYAVNRVYELRASLGENNWNCYVVTVLRQTLLGISHVLLIRTLTLKIVGLPQIERFLYQS